MKRFILNILIIFVIPIQVWSWDIKDVKTNDNTVKEETKVNDDVSQYDISQMYQNAKTKAAELKDSTAQQMTNMSHNVNNYSNKMINDVTNSIKLWIYETLKPTFTWIFIILFLLMFGTLKMVLPFSNYAIIQLPIFLGSYIFIFSLFYQLEITSYALEATFWFLIPIIIVGIILFFLRKTLVPKIKELNKKFNLEEEKQFEVKTNVVH